MMEWMPPTFVSQLLDPGIGVFIRVDGVLKKDRSANTTEEEEMTPMMPPA
jgi:hypothetical protein